MITAICKQQYLLNMVIKIQFHFPFVYNTTPNYILKLFIFILIQF